jgi:hypothetical protein
MAASAPDPQGGRTGALLDAIATQRRELDQGRAAVQQGAGDRHRRMQIAQDVTRAENDLDAAIIAAVGSPDAPSDEAILDAAAISPERLSELREQRPGG